MHRGKSVCFELEICASDAFEANSKYYSSRADNSAFPCLSISIHTINGDCLGELSL